MTDEQIALALDLAGRDQLLAALFRRSTFSGVMGPLPMERPGDAAARREARIVALDEGLHRLYLADPAVRLSLRHYVYGECSLEEALAACVCHLAHANGVLLQANARLWQPKPFAVEPPAQGGKP